MGTHHRPLPATAGDQFRSGARYPPVRRSSVVVAWLVLGVLLFLFELRHLAFYALFGAIGSLAAALVAAVAPSGIPLQAGVAVGVAGVGVVAVRPYVSRAFAHRREGHVARGVHGGLVGQEAVTLDEVGDAPQLGHVRLVGERWLAVSGSGQSIPARTTVLVTAVRGTTLTVWPVDGLDHQDELGPAE
jgi:membrane protein implicated in regulation of membrane protease activity